MLQRIALILGLAMVAGAASAEPQGRPKPVDGLFPIGGLAGGLVAPRAR